MIATMTRRRLMLGALACPICLAAGRVVAAEGGHWGYAGAQGPERWGKLDPAYGACGAGREQSPIDLDGAVAADTPAIAPRLKPVPLHAIHNGHTIQVDCAGGGYTTVGTKAYDLVQFHFHHPSEHLVAGHAYSMEVHLVHRAVDGELAVLGVLIEAGAVNPALAAVWAVMPRVAGPAVTGPGMVDPAALVPEGPVWRYAGSLTTPPCTEIVQWAVFQTPITASAEQIATFATLFANNARPVQPLGRRFLLRSGG